MELNFSSGSIQQLFSVIVFSLFSITHASVGIDAVIIKRPSILKKNRLDFLIQQCSMNRQLFRLPHEMSAHNTLCTTIYNLINSIADSAAFSFAVRVLLDEKLSEQLCTWSIKAPYGFLVYSAHKPQNVYHMHEQINICYEKNKWHINGKVIEDSVVIVRPVKEYIHWADRFYQGIFILMHDQGHSYLINQLDIEDYVYAVLRWESWPGWPLEVNKALAIATRSYLMFKVLQAHKQRLMYHIKNTNIHQTYNGVHDSIRLKSAVQETKGLILTHNRKPIDAMFDCCCGDVIPADVSYIDFKKAPYLARTYACNFCKNSKIYRWHIQCSLRNFADILHKAGYSLGAIVDVRVAQKDAAGTVQAVNITSTNQCIVLTGKQFYNVLNDIKSFAYDIVVKENSIIIEGKGYGHHVGICQWGARAMIDHGWNYRSILSFYYPGTTLMQLKTTKAFDAKL